MSSSGSGRRMPASRASAADSASGLSIARQLTEMHGGTLDASSAGVGRDATFRV